jgi:hypothetical protein
VVQIPSDDKENWFYSEPTEVSFEHNKRFKYGAVSVFISYYSSKHKTQHSTAG